MALVALRWSGIFATKDRTYPSLPLLSRGACDRSILSSTGRRLSCSIYTIILRSGASVVTAWVFLLVRLAEYLRKSSF